MVHELRTSQQHLTAGLRKGGWTQLSTFRWRDVRPGAAARAALGVIVPLVVGLASQRTEYGVYAALGALPAGMASFQGVSRSRISAVAIATVGAAVSTVVGAMTAAHDTWLFVPVTAALCFVVGLFSALGPRVSIATLQWPVALMISSAVPLDVPDSLLRGAFVLAGGGLQALLVFLSWTFSRGNAELAALSQAYRALGVHATTVAGHDGRVPPTMALPGADSLRDPNPLLRTPHRLVLLGLLTQAERMRTTLTVIGAQPVDEHVLLREVAVAMDAVADALIAPRSQRRARLAAVGHSVAGICAGGGQRSWAGESLLGQLRNTSVLLEDLGEGSMEAGTVPRILHAPGPRRAELEANLASLRASTSAETEAGRHAIRLAVVAAVAEMISLIIHADHGYWITIAAVIILRPDYTGTIQRGLQRAAGTAIGAGLGALTVVVLPRGHGPMVAAAALAIAVCYSLTGVNYLIFTAFLTTFVVDLLSLLGRDAESTASTRVTDTLLGAALALVAYVVWPTWEGRSARVTFAHLAQAQGRYAVALLEAHARPGRADDRMLRELQLAARRSRSEAETSLDRLHDEPPMPPMTTDLAEELMATSQRTALTVLGLHAALRHRDARSLSRERTPTRSPRSGTSSWASRRPWRTSSSTCRT